jgi:hypothetical protein
VVTIRLATDGPQVIQADTLGAAWLAVATSIPAGTRWPGWSTGCAGVAYAHSIDFGAKGYGNLVELASLQRHVAGQLGLQAGRLLLIVKSAHVYETERGYLREVLGRAR